MKNLKDKPPVVRKPQAQHEDSGDEDEEEMDQFEDQPQQQYLFTGQQQREIYQENKPPKPTTSAQPLKADHSIGIQHQGPPPKPKTKIHDYTPLGWKDFYDELIFIENGTPLFLAGIGNAPIFLCLHGAGHSALSFASLAKQIKQFAMCAAFDFRNHGLSQIDDYKLDTEQLIADTIIVVDYLIAKYPIPSIIIVGHSMGGAIAAKTTERLLESGKYGDKLQGLIVIDVVEGTAIEALPFMEQIVSQRPKAFRSYEQAIQWALNTSTLKNVTSARASIPPQLKEKLDEDGKLVSLSWRVDLMQTECYWRDWFKDLNKSFLSIRIPKILMLAERERLDKELAVAQMQGKFRLVVLYDTGHSIQEDDAANTAQNMYEFLTKFRIPTTTEEVALMKERGVGGFTPALKPFKKQLT